jgi:hypothetical protein
MREVLHSVCGGNWRGYEGIKEEIPAMFEKCLTECGKNEVVDLNYNRKHMDEIQPNENGLYEVTYWSKW